MEWPSNTPLDLGALYQAVETTCRAESETPASAMEHLKSFLAHPISQSILSCPADTLNAYLVNDFYKPKMHRMYATEFTGVSADFQLQVRSSPISLFDIKTDMPVLWDAFVVECHKRLDVQPYPKEIRQVLLHHNKFSCPQAMVDRAVLYNVASNITWTEVSNDSGSGCSIIQGYVTGPIESASHVETTLTQCIEELVVAAQVERIKPESGVVITNEQLLANALVKLHRGVEQLNTDIERQPGTTEPQLVLFSGRRASSRRFLLLQNWYCMQFLRGYGGSSSVYVAALLDKFMADNNLIEDQIEGLKLQGTLAHEVVSITEQLLGKMYDVVQSTNSGTTDGTTNSNTEERIQITPLLAHLLVLKATGGVHLATALADTFGTAGFVATALKTYIPRQFLIDVELLYPTEYEQLPAVVKSGEGTVFDLFRVWRLDSGSYEEAAHCVQDAYKSRIESLQSFQHPPAPPPRFMHSNLSNYEEIIQYSKTAPGIRPSYFAFGTLADGFTTPFTTTTTDDTLYSPYSNKGGVQEAAVDIKLCSVVMKAVQAAHPTLDTQISESAGKLGDGTGKLTVDCRIGSEAQQRTRQRLCALKGAGEMCIDIGVASKVLAEAYNDVTRKGILK